MINPTEIRGVLDDDTVAASLAHLESVTWCDGKETAGPIAASVKNNLQADEEQAHSLRAVVGASIGAHPLFQAIVRPSQISLMFSRYDVGSEYGAHVDSAYVGALPYAARRDVSFTLFLSKPTEYQGGELIIETPFEEHAHKLAAGSMIVYPATAIHRVTKVTSGSRIVVVGWARSLIRDAAKRELLFELDAVKSALFEQMGKCNEIDVLAKCSANLLRMWMED